MEGNSWAMSWASLAVTAVVIFLEMLVEFNPQAEDFVPAQQLAQFEAVGLLTQVRTGPAACF